MLDDKSLDKISARTRARTTAGCPSRSPTTSCATIYEIMKWGPTSANSQPVRIIFVRTREGKEKLRPALEQRQYGTRR